MSISAAAPVPPVPSLRQRESLSLERLDEAIRRAARLLLTLQQPEGCWSAELEADTTLESDTLKLWHLFGRVDPERQRRLVRAILKNQLPDGGWPIYAGGPANLNAAVKAYVALRLAGHSPEEPALRRAGEKIRALGGLERIKSFEKVYIALFGLYPWDQVPALPPELVLLPRWFPLNIYEVAYWSRTILVPLSVVYALKPRWARASFGLDELWVDPTRKRAAVTNLQKGGAGWRLFFLLADRFLRFHEHWSWKPFRAAALRRADRWITERLQGTDGLGAIFPAMINALFALKALGYADGDPLFEQQIKELERLELPDEDGSLKVQPCFSPVWDTGLALYVLGKVREPGSAPGARELAPELDEALERSARWLKEREIRTWGDWRVKNRAGRPGGWAFQFRNPFYPDVDDTAQVLLGLNAFYGKPAASSLGCFERGLAWILSMQNRDGGFASFDKNNNRRMLNHFPFADHNAMLDPSAADITGRILELCGEAGLSNVVFPSSGHPAVKRAVEFLRGAQEPDGTWFGRWGVSYIYGIWLALRGLKAVGEPMESVRYQQAGRWLINHQNPDGGWGESCLSYDDPAAKGKGESTPSQTAWALMALGSLEQVTDPAFRRGVQRLLDTQLPDGGWAEGPFTGTGFPKVFYLKYHFYQIYFPLLALLEARRFFAGRRVLVS